MSICGYIRIYLAVYGQEIIGGFGLEEKSKKKTKVVCGLGRTIYDGLRNVGPPIIDPRHLNLKNGGTLFAQTVYLIRFIKNISGLLPFPNTAFQFIQVR